MVRRAWFLSGALMASSATGWALPELGARMPSAVLVDADDRTLQVQRLVGQPVLVVYEDKGSAAQNASLKARLAALARGDRYKGAISLVAVADVSGYDYWPVRGFVKDAIRGESARQGTTIWCDWSGSFRSTFGLRQGASNVVLFARDGSVVFASSGPLDTKEQDVLIDRLRAMF